MWNGLIALVLLLGNSLFFYRTLSKSNPVKDFHFGLTTTLFIFLFSILPHLQLFWQGQVVVFVNILFLKYMNTFANSNDISKISFSLSLLACISALISPVQIGMIVVRWIVASMQNLFNSKVFFASLFAVGLFALYYFLAIYFNLATQPSFQLSHYNWIWNTISMTSISFIIALFVLLMIMFFILWQAYAFETQKNKYPLVLMIILIIYALMSSIFIDKTLMFTFSVSVPMAYVYTYFNSLKTNFFNFVILVLFIASLLALAVLQFNFWWPTIKQLNS